jgi:hypothetical protein
MFNFLKKIFVNKPDIEEIKISELQQWINNKVSNLPFKDFLKDYYSQIETIKENIIKRTQELQEQEVPKEHQVVEERIKNIVKGHRDNYVREITRFIEHLNQEKKEKHSSLQYYLGAIEFNTNLNKEFDGLAKRTAKSYQASQHIYFDQVEAVFKQMGELNLLLRKFEKESENVQYIKKLQQSLSELEEEQVRTKNIKKDLTKKEEEMSKSKQELEKLKEQLEQLQKSKEYNQYQELKKQEESLNKEILDNENLIFSYFSKLSKALRKYERVALDNKLITTYLEDSVKAFKDDQELNIKEILQGLNKSLDSLNFDDKQKSNIIELIKKSEGDYLEELKNKNDQLSSQNKELIRKINSKTITSQIEEKEKEINSQDQTVKRQELELEKISSTKNNENEIIEEIKEIGKKINLKVI